jgi:hypothetical protein
VSGKSRVGLIGSCVEIAEDGLNVVARGAELDNVIQVPHCCVCV